MAVFPSSRGMSLSSILSIVMVAFSPLCFNNSCYKSTGCGQLAGYDIELNMCNAEVVLLDSTI